MSTKLSFAVLREGDEIAPLVRGEITKQMLVEYGEAALDGNPMHTDDEFAQDAGYPGVFAQGMLSMGFLGQFLVERFGIDAVRRFKVRFSRITWPGETITCRGVVSRKYTQAGEKLVELEIRTENQEGEQKLVGTATVRLA